MSKANILLLGFLMIFGGLWAQEGPHSQRKEAHEAVRAYVSTNVIPVINQQRTKLDIYLSADEQTSLEVIREELKNLHEARRAKMKEKRATFKESGERPTPTEEEKAEMKEAAKTRRLLMTRAWEIADAHEAEIEMLLSELDPQKEIWKEGIKSIMDDFHPEDKPERVRNGHGGDRPERMEGPRGRRSMGRRGPGGPGMGIMREIEQPVMFLLFDEEMINKAGMEPTENITVFPNPTERESYLTYEVTEVGKVTILLLDGRGNVLQTVLNTFQEEGTYEQLIDLGGLRPGVYLYQIQTPEGTTTRKVVKQ